MFNVIIKYQQLSYPERTGWFHFSWFCHSIGTNVQKSYLNGKCGRMIRIGYRNVLHVIADHMTIQHLSRGVAIFGR